MSYAINCIIQKGFSIVTVNPDKLLFSNNFVSPKGKIVNSIDNFGLNFPFFVFFVVLETTS